MTLVRLTLWCNNIACLSSNSNCVNGKWKIFHRSLPDPHQQPLVLILGVPGQPPVLCRSFFCLVIPFEDQPALDNTSFYCLSFPAQQKILGRIGTRNGIQEYCCVLKISRNLQSRHSFCIYRGPRGSRGGIGLFVFRPWSSPS